MPHSNLPSKVVIFVIIVSRITSPTNATACTTTIGSVNCDDLCIETGFFTSWADGVYHWNGNVHICESCYDDYSGNNLYIYPWITNQTMSWYIGDDPTSNTYPWFEIPEYYYYHQRTTHNRLQI